MSIKLGPFPLVLGQMTLIDTGINPDMLALVHVINASPFILDMSGIQTDPAPWLPGYSDYWLQPGGSGNQLTINPVLEGANTVTGASQVFVSVFVQGEQLPPASNQIPQKLPRYATPGTPNYIYRSTNAASGSSILLHLNATSTQYAWLAGFIITAAQPTTSETLAVTITGGASGITFQFPISNVSGGYLAVQFPSPIPTLAIGGQMTVSTLAGNEARSLYIYGFFQ